MRSSRLSLQPLSLRMIFLMRQVIAMCCAYPCKKHIIALSYADITSGEFVLRTVPFEKQFTSLLSVLEQVGPREVLVDEDDYFSNPNFKLVIDGHQAMVTKLPPWYFKIKDGFELMCSQVETSSLKAFSLESNSLVIASGGALLRYLKDSAKTVLAHITHFTVESEGYISSY